MEVTRSWWLLLPLTGVMLLAGACQKPLPATQDWPGHEQAMEQLALQQQAIRLVSGRCTFRLRDAQGRVLSLDGALALQQPGHLRLRAWKLHQAVFDLTLTPEGLWLMTAEDLSEAMVAELSASTMAGSWALLDGSYFPAAQAVAGSPAHHVVERVLDDGQLVRCTIDRQTLLPWRFDYLDGAGAVTASLLLERYAMIDGHPWPMRLVFDRPLTQVILELSEVRINQPLAAAAFTPPRRAERQP